MRQTAVCLIFIMALAVSALWPAGARGFSNGKQAPDIVGGPWINSNPMSLSDLKDRVVLVEFWTYG